MATSIPPERAREILREIQRDKKAMGLLRAKCRWERSTVLQVLCDWGDPRNWSVGKGRAAQPRKEGG